MGYFISERFLTRLGGICVGRETDTVGYLHSFTVGTDTHLVSCSALSSDGEPNDVYHTVTRSLPGGIDVCGLFFTNVKASDSDSVQRICKTRLCDAIELLRDQCAVLVFVFDPCGPRDDRHLYRYNVEEDTLVSMPFTTTDTDILSTCMLARLQATLPINREHSSNNALLENEVESDIEAWKEELMSPTTAFHVQDSNVMLFYNEEVPKADYNCRELVAQIQREDEDEFDRKKKQKLKDFSNEVVHLTLLRQSTGGIGCPLSTSCAPLIRHNHGSFTQLDMSLPIDVVAYIHPDMSTEYLSDVMVDCIRDQLNALQRTLLSHKDGSIHTPLPRHFRPSCLGHILTLVYSQGSTEDELEPLRKTIHSTFHLPCDIPQVRRLNAHIFPDESHPGGCLINPHSGLQASGVAGGCVSMVTGRYAYHHYMQDRMDDNGWGCAYRSLQTLVSWFRLQGYTDKPVPSHREIQQALADIGDKEAKFVGTKQWIGSTEVNYVLDHLLGVTSKILYVSSGAELESKGRELAIHFDTQGSPVMIGGGVLAHTILGIDFNEVTGDVKFLILDPHYTGGENIKLIQDKGWCGWKGPDFWDKNAYYNMCMPQRPAII